MRIDFQLGRPARGQRKDRRRDVRRRRQLGGGRARRADGAEVIGITLQLYDHGAAVGRTGACCAGQDIRDAQRGRRPARHRALRVRSRKPLPRGGDRAVRRRICSQGERRSRASAATWASKFTDLFAHRARAGRRLPRDRPLCAPGRERRPAPSCTGRRSARATRAISSTRRRASSSITCAFRSAACPRTRCARIAAELGLEVAAKPDSQDICFVPDGDYAGLVKGCGRRRRRRARSSTCDGRVLGEHRGVIHFTVGQRRGLEIGGQPEPLYVVRIEPAEARMVVGPRRALAVERDAGRRWNWIGEEQRRVSVKVRSLAQPVAGGPGQRLDPLRPARIWRRSGAGRSALRGNAAARRRDHPRNAGRRA